MNKGFPIEWLEELKRKNDIVSVVSRYLTLQSKGKTCWACCPFHHEKDASFCIYPMDQVYHCYGCKEHGDVIKFVQKMESCDFWQACEILAKGVGMDMPTLTSNVDIQKRKEEKDTILKVLDCTYKHYEQNLYLKTSTLAQQYIKKRKLTKKELDKFHIGYSTSWTEMLDYLTSKGFSYKELQLANVAECKNDRYYDVMGERLIFPIFNIHDECIGFSARSLSPDARAKYKNSVNSVVFDKSKNMYGINIVRRLKQTQKINYIIIVEGQMDVISMNKAGFENSVACLGTALTLDHARALKNICEKVVVCLDGDSAGQKATIRTIDVLVEAGLDVKAVKLPDNLDPDEYINKYGKEEMQKQLDNALDYVEFKIRHRYKEYDVSKKDEKAKFVNIALSIVNELDSNSEKQIYLDIIKKLSGVPIDILNRDLSKDLTSIKENTVEETTLQNTEDAEIKAIKFILASILHRKQYSNFDFNLKKYLINNSYVKLYDLLKDAHSKDEILMISSLYDIFDIENEPNISDIIGYNFEEIENPKQYYTECVWKIRETYLKNEIQVLTNQFKNAESQEERMEIMKKLNNEQKKLKAKSLEE